MATASFVIICRAYLYYKTTEVLTGNTVFRTFSYMLWHIELKFCTWLCSNVLQIKFECRQFVSIFVRVMPLLELKILQIHSFPHFSLTCFDILSWNFAYDFVLVYYRSSSSVVNFCVSYAPFGTQNTENIQFPHFFLTCFDLLSWKFAHGFVLLK